MAHYQAVMVVLTHPEFLASSEEYKKGIHRLFYYGLIGR